jgi:cytochrome c oxidase subunit 3
MSAIPPPLGVDRTKSGLGRGGVLPPVYGGGGDRGPDDGPPDYENRLRRARLGLILGFISISMLFVTVTMVFVMRQSATWFDAQTPLDLHEWIPVKLPIRLLLWNTVVLLVSSIPMELARRALAREMVFAPVTAITGIAAEPGPRVPWLGLTALLGLLFLAGQGLAWEVVSRQAHHAATALSPLFYILTGAHAAHLTVGVLAVLYALVISILHRPIATRRIAVEISSWYWHFMGALWLLIFVLLVSR